MGLTGYCFGLLVHVIVCSAQAECCISVCMYTCVYVYQSSHTIAKK